MRVDIQCRPSYAMAYVFLEYGESFLCEQGAMAAMSQGISASGTTAGNVAKAFLRRFADETFFMGKYTAEAHGAWVAVAPKYPGDIEKVDITPQNGLIISSGSLIGHAETVEGDLKYAGARSVVLREGATALHLKGEGVALMASYGGIQSFELGHGDSVIIDTGHLVAWSPSISTKIGPLGGVVNSMMSGEGLVGELTGPGVVYMQTRAEQEFKNWIVPDREQNKKQ